MDRLKNGFIQTVVLLLLASIGALYLVLNSGSVVKNQNTKASAFGCLCPSDYVSRGISCIESGGINYVDTTQNQASCSYCGWAWAGNICCPSGGDSCTDIGAIKCDDNPRVLECKVWNSACPKGVWVTIQSYGTSEELHNDPRCSNPTPNPTPTPTPHLTPTPTPTATPTITPTPTPTVTPTPTPTPTPTVTPTPTITPTPTPTPTPTSTPNWCNGTCGSNYNCQGGYFCHDGFCRNPSCPDESDCDCAVSTPTPTPTAPPVLGATAPPSLPKTGGGMAAIFPLFGLGGVGIYLIKKYKLI